MLRRLCRARPMSKWWAISIVVILGVGLYAFPREYRDVRFTEALYYTLRLFVFEYDLPRFPSSWPLISIHFAAPVVSLSVAWIAASQLFRLTPALRLWRLSDHVVVCGVGRTGRIVAAALDQHGISVVGVDLGPPSAFEEWCAQEQVPMVWGSFHSRTTLERAGARRARAVVFTSGDDLANLEGAVAACAWLPATRQRPVPIWTHVADDRLARTADRAIRNIGSLSIKFFDTYDIAATKMLEQEFSRQARASVNEVFILGFGKFGRSLLETLLRSMSPEEALEIRVVDVKDRSGAVRAAARAHGHAERVTFVQSDINDLELAREAGKAYFLCTDDDLRNLTCAMMLSERLGQESICVRMTRWPIPAIAEQMGEGCGITFVNINELVADGIDELLAPGLYGEGPPTPRSHAAEGSEADRAV